MIRLPVAKIPFGMVEDMALVPPEILVNCGYVKERMTFGKRK